MRNAAELFVEQFNASGGDSGTRLELVVRDDFDDPEKARAAAAEMVKDDLLIAVIGHYYPATAMGTAKVFADAKIPFLSPNVSSPELLESSKWMFAVNFPDDVQGGFMAVYIKEVLKKDHVLLIHGTDSFGVSLRDAFLRKASHIGLNIRKVLPVDGVTVPAGWAGKNLPDPAENQKIGVVAALTRSEPGLVFLPQLRDQGVMAPVMATTSWTNPKFLHELDEKYTANVHVISAFLWEIANQKASRFARAYQTKFGASPTVAAAMTSDAALLLAQAIGSFENPANKATPTREGVRDFLAGLNWHHAVEGATGNLYFSNDADKTAQYVAQYNASLHTAGNESKDAGGQPDLMNTGEGKAEPRDSRVVNFPVPDIKQETKGRAVQRDLFVSVIKDGRFKTAAVQLLRPREEYVLKELAERVGKGQVMVVDNQPYHLVDVIFSGVDVIKINDVNIKDMTWDVDVFMWFKWSGTRLDGKDIEKIGIINAVKEQSVVFKEDLSRPVKYRAYRKRLTLSAPYDLSAFPFDSQTLPMSIAHTNKNSTHVMLVLDSRHMDDSPVREIQPQEWLYQGRNTFSDLYQYQSTFGDPDYRMGTGYKSPIYFSTVNLELSLKRILKPYIFTFFLPLMIILGVILLILWVPLDQFGPRISACISGLVGTLVYHMSQKNSFPKVGYTMVADYYFLVSYAFVVVMTIFIIYTQTMVSHGHKDLAKIWNRRLSLGAMLSAVTIFGVMTWLAMH